MHSKEIYADDAVGRVLDQLVKDYRRRQELVRRSSTELMQRHQADEGRRHSIQMEAIGSIDALEWAVDRINDLRLPLARQAQRRADSTIAGHTDTVELP